MRDVITVKFILEQIERIQVLREKERKILQSLAKARFRGFQKSVIILNEQLTKVRKRLQDHTREIQVRAKTQLITPIHQDALPSSFLHAEDSGKLFSRSSPLEVT